jgi:hypothetical protein
MGRNDEVVVRREQRELPERPVLRACRPSEREHEPLAVDVVVEEA